jgi:hypothetical protein
MVMLSIVAYVRKTLTQRGLGDAGVTADVSPFSVARMQSSWRARRSPTAIDNRAAYANSTAKSAMVRATWGRAGVEQRHTGAGGEYYAKCSFQDAGNSTVTTGSIMGARGIR